VDQNSGSYSARDEAISSGTGNCYSNNSYCPPLRQSYDSAFYAGSLNALNAGFTGTVTAPTPSAGDNSTKVATTAYVRGENYMTWACPLFGTGGGSQLSSVQSYCNWTVPAGITVTGIDFFTQGAPTSCTTYPVVKLWDGTSAGAVGSYSFTLDNSTLFYTQVSGSSAVASGHTLRMRVTTGSSGCSGNNYVPTATITYQMTN
jgi:hypothetical protein